jgi:sialic acid synthase SpsE
MEPGEFATLVREGNIARESLGSARWKMQPSESESRRLRRTLFIVKDVKAGEEVTHENVKAIRPGNGAPPKFLEEWLGREFKQSYFAGTPLDSELLA